MTTTLARAVRVMATLAAMAPALTATTAAVRSQGGAAGRLRSSQRRDSRPRPRRALLRRREFCRRSGGRLRGAGGTPHATGGRRPAPGPGLLAAARFRPEGVRRLPPQTAVDHFVRWAAEPADAHTKAAYYPDVPKSELFARGYIAEMSGHSRGSTVDLTVVRLSDGAELDMGTPFDFFGPESAFARRPIEAAGKPSRELP